MRLEVLQRRAGPKSLEHQRILQYTQRIARGEKLHKYVRVKVQGRGGTLFRVQHDEMLYGESFTMFIWPFSSIE